MDILLTDTHSLKDKRSILNYLKNQVRKQFNVSVAELGYHDQFGRTRLGIVTINNESRIVDQVLNQVEQFIEMHSNLQVFNRKMELI